LLKNASRKTLIKASVKYFTSTVPCKRLGIQNSGKFSDDRSGPYKNKIQRFVRYGFK
jgi:hypothetical protein